MLFSAFFMPAVDGCRSPVVPAEFAWEILEELPREDWAWSTIPELIAAFAMFVAAYLFGLLVVIICMRGWSFRHSREKNLGISVAILVGFLSIPMALYCGGLLIGKGLPGWGVWNAWAIFFVALAVVSPLYFLRSIRMGPAGLLCLRWYAALCGLAWFGALLMDAGVKATYYGLWLSMTALILILISTHGEARIRTRRSRKRTFWNLLRGRLQLYDLDGPRCFDCGYLLIGLPLNRCPECGLAFDPAEHGLVFGDGIHSTHHFAPGESPGAK